MGHFGKHLAEVNDNLVVGVPTYNYDEDNPISGYIYVFDGDTGDLLFTIDYPEENLHDVEFGAYLTAVGDNIALRSIGHDSEGPATDLIYIFDGKTGELLLTIDEQILRDQNSALYISSVNNDENLVISGMNVVEKYSQLNPVYVFEGISTTIDYSSLIVIACVVSAIMLLSVIIFKKRK